MATEHVTEVAEYRGKTLTPVSPRPLHVAEPSSIPVLEKQMDPAFNETSAHLDSSKVTQPAPTPSGAGQQNLLPEQPMPTSYPRAANAPLEPGIAQADAGSADTDINDDYAMSLDLDDDESWDGPINNPSGYAANSTASIFPPADDATMNIANSLSLAGDNAELPAPATAMFSGLTDRVDASEHTTAEHDAVFDASLLDRKTEYQDLTADRDESAGGDVDIQALLDNLSPPVAAGPSAEGIAAAAGDHPAVSAGVVNAGSGPTLLPSLTPNPILPGSPPFPLHDNVDSNQSLPVGDYSDPAYGQIPIGVSSAFASDESSTFVSPQQLDARLSNAGTSGAVGQPVSSLESSANSTQKPPQPQKPAEPREQSHVVGRRQSRHGNKADGAANKAGKLAAEDDDSTWNADIQKSYDDFLSDERHYGSDGPLDRFPPNSRLFIGNLPTEKVSKRDLFYIFHKYGRLAQVSIKQAYGFVQFLDADACRRALQAEQGQTVRGRKMHLEISKPQKNTRGGGGDQGANRAGKSRHSRSPDYLLTRKQASPRGGGGRDRDRVDRGVDNRSGRHGRDRGYSDRRGRDDYHPPRSPSPRGHRGSDDFRRGRDRSHDRYNGGGRRSRSRSPPRRGNRHHSRSPSRWTAEENVDVTIPKRQPGEVPDVQIIVLDELDRNFVAFVEKAFRDRGLRTDVFTLNSRVSLMDVVKRHVLEGVDAIVRLTRQCQATSKIPLQVFDRTAGMDNVRFDEYNPLEPPVAAEIVANSAQKRAAAAASAAAAVSAATSHNQFQAASQPYALPQFPSAAYAAPPAVQPNAGTSLNASVPNLASLITALDGPTLQRLLGALQQPAAQQPQQPQQPAPASAPPVAPAVDLASLLNGSTASRQPQQMPYPPVQANPYAAFTSNSAFAGNPALASLLHSTTNRAPQAALSGVVQQPLHQGLGQMVPPSQTIPQVQNIMEQLSKWKQ